jgi:nitroreductase
MELMQAILGRRSIRSYRPDPVPQADLQHLLEAARQAPSWANTQCWEFVIVTDGGLKERLAATLPEKNPARPAFAQAPVIIAACAITGLSGFFKGSPATDKGDWMLFDLGLALENLTLAAHEKGLGTVHVGFFDARAAGDILGLPAGHAVVELLPLGYPDGQARPTPRKPLDDFVFFNGYGRKA